MCSRMTDDGPKKLIVPQAPRDGSPRVHGSAQLRNAVLGRFTEDLSALQRAIRWGDGEALFTHFTRTRAVRRSIIDLGQEVDAPDFGRRTKPDDETQ